MGIQGRLAAARLRQLGRRGCQLSHWQPCGKAASPGPGSPLKQRAILVSAQATCSRSHSHIKNCAVNAEHFLTLHSEEPCSQKCHSQPLGRPTQRGHREGAAQRT